MKMELADINGRIRAIEAIADDDEMAHADQDKLLRDVLEHVAQECPRPQACAREALRVFDVKFSRWYA